LFASRCEPPGAARAGGRPDGAVEEIWPAPGVDDMAEEKEKEVMDGGRRRRLGPG
jgi:hypothetical protein